MGKSVGLLTREFDNKKIINLLLCSIICIMPFIIIPNTKQPYITGKVIYIYFAVITIILFSIIDRIKIVINLEEKIILIFLLSLIVATIFSIDVETAIVGKTGRYEGLLMLISYIILFYIASKYLNPLLKVINILSFFSCIMSIYTIIQFYGVDYISKYVLPNLDGYPISATIGNRNYIGTYCLLFLIINIAIYLKNEYKINFLFSVVLFCGLLATLTRGCWVAFVIVSLMGFILFRSKKYLRRVVLILVTFITVFLVMNFTSGQQLINRGKTIASDVINMSEESGSGRIMIWKMTLRSISKGPVLGSGLDTLDARLLEDQFSESLKLAMQGIIIDKAHNEFLEYWACGGIVTVLSYISLISVILYKLFKHREDDVSKIFMLTIMGYIVQSFFNNSVIAVAPLYWIFLGAAVKHYRDLDKAKTVQAIAE